MESAVATVVAAVVVIAAVSATVPSAVSATAVAAAVVAATRPENQKDDNPPAGIVAEAVAARVVTHNGSLPVRCRPWKAASNHRMRHAPGGADFFMPERLEQFLPPLSLRDISPALRGRQIPVRFRGNVFPCRPHEVGGDVAVRRQRGRGRRRVAPEWAKIRFLNDVFTAQVGFFISRWRGGSSTSGGCRKSGCPQISRRAGDCSTRCW